MLQYIIFVVIYVTHIYIYTYNSLCYSSIYLLAQTLAQLSCRSMGATEKSPLFQYQVDVVLSATT